VAEPAGTGRVYPTGEAGQQCDAVGLAVGAIGPLGDAKAYEGNQSRVPG
jgi:hypothetical protein